MIASTSALIRDILDLIKNSEDPEVVNRALHTLTEHFKGTEKNRP
jgi:hypothetical protein